MRKVRSAASGAAPIAPEVLRFFMGIGVPVLEVYGMSENSAIATANRPGRVKVGTVGEPQPGTELRIDETTGEILTRHPGTFAGYWRRPEATAQASARRLAAHRRRRRVGRRHPRPDHRPDQGHHHHGRRQEHLAVGDRERAQGLAVRQGGRRRSATGAPTSRRSSGSSSTPSATGPSAAGSPTPPTATWPRSPRSSRWCRASSTSVNASFASVEQVKKFRMLPKELDHEDGELTATQKVKRAALGGEFGDLVASMYGEPRMNELLQQPDPRPRHRDRSTPCSRSAS